jgi:hypothetical protein
MSTNHAQRNVGLYLGLYYNQSMTYRGHIKNGVAVLDPAVLLPDGTPVRIEVAPADSAFWQGQTAAELALEQGVQPIVNFGDLAIEWPEEDSIDEFLALVREVRR